MRDLPRSIPKQQTQASTSGLRQRHVQTISRKYVLVDRRRRIPVERNLQPLESSRALVMPGPDLGMCSGTQEGCVSYIVPYHALQLCELGADMSNW